MIHDSSLHKGLSSASASYSELIARRPILRSICHLNSSSLNTFPHTQSSSTRSLISAPQRQYLTDSSTMDNGKTPQGGMRNGGGPIINVQPPRREDLQPSYAQTLQGDADAGAHGWYGSMSEFSSLTLPENVADGI